MQPFSVFSCKYNESYQQKNRPDSINHPACSNINYCQQLLQLFDTDVSELHFRTVTEKGDMPLFVQ